MSLIDNTTIRQNQIPNEPELKDVLDLHKKDIFLTLNCHHIGTVQLFNSLTQTAQVTINYKKTYFRFNAVTKKYEPTLVDYPIILDAPVICLGGGPGALTFPITTGDECLVLFNDRDIDNWFQGKSNGAVATPRMHSTSDALILVGVRSLNSVLTAYNAAETELRFGTTTLSLSATGAKITIGSSGAAIEINAAGQLNITNVTGDFVSMLVQLFTDIQNGLVSTMLGPQPLQMPTFAVDLAKLQTFQP